MSNDLFKRARCYSFTCNNPDQSDYERIIDLPNLVKVKELIFQYELGPTRLTPHFQGMIYFVDSRLKKQVIDLLKGCHIDIAQNVFALKNYVQKLKTKLGQEYYHFKDNEVISMFKQLELIKDTLLLNIEQFIPLKDDLYLWQQKIEKIFLSKVDRRTINYIYDSAGNSGKSSIVDYLKINYINKVYSTSGRPEDVKYAFAKLVEKVGNINIRLIIWDIPRLLKDKGLTISKTVFLTAEQFKNGCIFSTKYESIEVRFGIPHIIIFTNLKPKKFMFESGDKQYLSRDRIRIYKIENKDLIKVEIEELE